MARAFVYEMSNMSGNLDGTVSVTLDILFSGVDVYNNSDFSMAVVTIDPNDSLINLKAALVNGVLAEAARIGYALVASDILLPAWMKGA